MLSTAVVFLGCAQKAEKEIARKMAVEPPVANVEEFSTQSDHILENAEALSDAQRAQLIVLRRETLNRLDQQDKTEMQLRLVLFKEILKPEYSQREVNLLKQKIKKANKQKYTIWIEAFKESHRILGKPYAKGKNFFDDEHTARGHELR